MDFPLDCYRMGGVGKGRSRGRQVLHIAMVPIIDIGWIAGFNQSNFILHLFDQNDRCHVSEVDPERYACQQKC